MSFYCLQLFVEHYETDDELITCKRCWTTKLLVLILPLVGNLYNLKCVGVKIIKKYA